VPSDELPLRYRRVHGARACSRRVWGLRLVYALKLVYAPRLVWALRLVRVYS